VNERRAINDEGFESSSEFLVSLNLAFGVVPRSQRSNLLVLHVVRGMDANRLTRIDHIA